MARVELRLPDRSRDTICSDTRARSATRTPGIPLSKAVRIVVSRWFSASWYAERVRSTSAAALASKSSTVEQVTSLPRVDY